MGEDRGHAFICYVREDADDVDELAALLVEAGIPVWRDTDELWPGQDWQMKIREAITDGAFAFIACFSTRSVAKGVSGQWPELYLAVDEFKKRPPGVPWIFPVRFDACDVPKLDLGGGKTLADIQWADLHGPNRDRNGQRLVGAVQAILQSLGPPQAVAGPVPAAAPAGTRDEPLQERLKQALRANRADIVVHDLVMPIAESVGESLADRAAFPTEAPSVDVRAIVELVHRQWQIVEPLLEIFVTAGLWGDEPHEATWKEATERVGSTVAEFSGNTALLAVRSFALLPIVYATGMAAMRRNNFGPLRSVAIDATVKDIRGRTPVIARTSPWLPFDDLQLSAQVLAFEASGEVVDDELIEALRTRRRGHRYTPGSDVLHDRLRESFARVIVDDDEYSDTFDRLEILLGLLIADARAHGTAEGPWIPYPFVGRFTWRDRYSRGESVIERRVLTEVEQMGDKWPPLRGGLFGGDIGRARAAFEAYLPIAANGREQRW